MPVETIYLALPVNSPIGAEMSPTASFVHATPRLSPIAQAAQAVFELLGETREREVLAINSQGRATRIPNSPAHPLPCAGSQRGELIGPTDLMARRDITFNESDLLAKESEEGLLYRDMQSDLVRQIVSRLAGMRAEAT